MKTKDFALQVKDLSEDGTFEGYGSIFGNVDSYGEKVVPGAFIESLVRHKREGTAVLMLWQHNPEEPIGVWDDLAEDAKGLWGNSQPQRVPKQLRRSTIAKAIWTASSGSSWLASAR